MYLLILKSILYISLEYKFTSHYVSINSYSVGYRATWKLYLHPTMYLLILNLFYVNSCVRVIYIPLCIY